MDDRAPSMYVGILEALSTSPNGGRSIRLPISNGEPALLAQHHVRCGLLECVRKPRWVAVYRNPDPTVDHVVTVYTPDRPPKRKTLSGANGRRRYLRIDHHRIEGVSDMARTATKTRSRTRAKKAPETVDLEELEELEELEDLEVEEEAPAKPARKRRAKAAPDPEPEEDDEDDEDEDDEDDDDLESKSLKELRAMAKEAGIKSRGLDKDALIEALESADEEDEDDEEDEPEPPKRSRSRKPAASAAKPAAKKKPAAGSAVRELPKGKVGMDRVAELAGVDARIARQKLRGTEFADHKTDGRWAFTEAQAKKAAKFIAGKVK